MPPRYAPLPPPADPLLTLPEVADLLRCSSRTVQRWVKRGLLPRPLRLSAQKRLWKASVIRQFLDTKGDQTHAETTPAPTVHA